MAPTLFWDDTLQAINYLAGYPASIQQQAAELASSGKLSQYLHSKYPQTHQIQSDKAL